MTGKFFADLSPALQGIAVVKLENAIAFYDRVGWKDAYLDLPLEHALTDFQTNKINERLSLGNLHELAYVSHKHIEKMLGKIESSNLWERLKALKLNG